MTTTFRKLSIPLLLLGCVNVQAACINNGTGTPARPNTGDTVNCAGADNGLDIIIGGDDVSIVVEPNTVLTDVIVTFAGLRGSVLLGANSSITPFTGGVVRTILIRDTDVTVGSGAVVNGDRYGIASSYNVGASVTVQGEVNGRLGSISFGGGDDVLTLDTGALLVGDVTSGGGNDTLNLLGSGASATNILDFDTINMNGDQWSLSGSGFMLSNATVNVNSGELTTPNISDTTVVAAAGTRTRTAGVLNGSTVTLNGDAVLEVNVGRGNSPVQNFGISGTGRLQKEGAGTLTIASNSTLSHTGGTQINDGTLAIATPGQLGIGNIAIEGDGVLQFDHTDTAIFSNLFSGNGTFAKSGSGTLVFSNPSNFTGSVDIQDGVVVLNSSLGLGTADIDNNAVLRIGGVTLANNLSGTGLLEKTANNNAILTGTNSHSGGTHLVAGSLRGNADSFGSGTLQIDGSFVEVMHDATAAAVFDSDTAGSGELRKLGSGTVAFTGDLDHTGGIEVNGGTFLSQTNNLGSNAVSIAQDASWELQTGADTSFGNDVSGAGRLVKSGTATATLTGSVTHTGGTQIDAGRLLIDDISTLGGVLSLGSAGQLEIDSASDQTLSDDLSGGTLIQSGTGTLTLTGNNSHDSEVAGTLVANSASAGNAINLASGGTLIFNQQSDATANTTVDATNASVVKRGFGSLQLTADGDLGDLVVEAGRLGLDGDVSATIDVQVDAVLGGTGTIDGVVTNNGVLAPGNSIGTLTINGDYVQNAGSRLEIEMDTGSQIDQLVISGSATLNGGDVVFQSLNNADGAGLTFLSAAGGVTGTFASATLQGGGALEVVYDSNSVARDGPVIDVLSARPSTANSQMAASSLDTLAFADAVQHRAYGRLTTDDDTVWAHAYGTQDSRDATGANLGYDVKTHGFAIGGQRQLEGGWSVGGAIARNDGVTDLAARAGDTELDSLYATIHAGLRRDQWFVLAGGFWGQQQLDTQRTVSFNNVLSSLDSDTDGSVLGMYARTGLMLTVGDWLVEPNLGLTLSRTSLDGYAEEGGNLLRVAIDDLDVDDGRLSLQTRIQRPFQMANGMQLKPRIDLGVVRDFPMSDRDVKLTFAETATSVELDGDAQGRTQALFGLGVDLQVNEVWQVLFDARHVTGGGDDRTHVRLGVALKL